MEISSESRITKVEDEVDEQEDQKIAPIMFFLTSSLNVELVYFILTGLIQLLNTFNTGDEVIMDFSSDQK